jgi:hypothetical protein
MTRLYDKYGAYKCSVCQKHPSFGWLYRCTQDSNGFLPESDFIDITRPDKKKAHMDPSLHNLSSSVVRAISQGEYTDEQVKLLHQQKENVRNAILGLETRPTTADTYTTESTNFSALPASTTFSSNTSDTTLDEELRAAYDWSELQKAWRSEPTLAAGHRAAIEIDRETALQNLDLPEIKQCNFKICAQCRPTYQERATPIIDGVLKNPVMPPKWELDNRPASDGFLLANIGLPKGSRWYAISILSAIDSYHNSSDLLPSDEEISMKPSDNELNDHSFRRRSGFRQSVRNVFKIARPEKPASFVDPETPQATNSGVSQSTEDSPSPFSRSMLFRRRKSRPNANFTEPRTSVVGNTSLQDSLMLMLGVNTALPQGPRTPQSSNHSRSVSDFFAITETLSTPDEIMTQT